MRQLLMDNVVVQIHKYNGNPIGLQFPPHVELDGRRTPSRARAATPPAAA